MNSTLFKIRSTRDFYKRHIDDVENEIEALSKEIESLQKQRSGFHNAMVKAIEALRKDCEHRYGHWQRIKHNGADAKARKCIECEHNQFGG